MKAPFAAGDEVELTITRRPGQQETLLVTVLSVELATKPFHWEFRFREVLSGTVRSLPIYFKLRPLGVHAWRVTKKASPVVQVLPDYTPRPVFPGGLHRPPKRQRVTSEVHWIG